MFLKDAVNHGWGENSGGIDSDGYLLVILWLDNLSVTLTCWDFD